LGGEEGRNGFGLGGGLLRGESLNRKELRFGEVLLLLLLLLLEGRFEKGFEFVGERLL
jgi:hypothetical protein